MAPADVAALLEDSMFSSSAVIAVEPIIVQSLFGQHSRKKSRRTHELQSIAHDNSLAKTDLLEMLQIIEASNLISLSLDDPDAYMAAAHHAGRQLHRSSDSLHSLGSEAELVTSWCIAAYHLVIHPSSSVKLSVSPMGPQARLGFAIHARRPIREDETIHELIGLMPIDNETPHSRLSEISPAPEQNQPENEERVLFGPIRFINHRCQDFNTAFLAARDTSAFYVYAVRNIEVGEELTLDYGTEYFNDSGCPCTSCHPPSVQETSRPEEPAREVVDERELKEQKKREKRRRRDHKAAEGKAGKLREV